ncbi:rnb family domain-containing protein, partial [Cystoisospora suis]
EEIKIRGKANLNRAVEGDVVAVEIVSGGKTPSDTKKTSPSQPTSGSASSLSPSLITKEEEEKKKSEDRRDGKISVKQSSQEEEKENGGKDEDVGAKEFTASEEAQAEIKEIEDESLAVFPTAEMTDEEDEDEENKKEEETMEKDLSAEYLSDDILEGKVVGIIRKNRREYCGTVRPFNNPFRTELATRGLPAEVVFIPADRRIPNIILK